MAECAPIRLDPGPAHRSHLPASAARPSNFRGSGLWLFRLSPRLLPAGMFLARPPPLVESIQQLRHPVPRTVEYHAIISPGTHLSFVASHLVTWAVQSYSSFPGRVRHVPAGPPMGGKSLGGGHRRCRLQFQWSDAQFPDVAEPHCHAQLDALGRARDRTSLAARRHTRGSSRIRWSLANARRRPGNYPPYMAVADGALVGPN